MQEVFVSEFQPDAARSSRWLAGLWQGPAPEGVELRGWYYLEPRGMLVLWTAVDDDARGRFEAMFTSGGELTTRVSRDATPGLAAALARDLEGFGGWMRSRGEPEEAIERALDLRRRGMEAPTMEAAQDAGAAWAAEQPPRS